MNDHICILGGTVPLRYILQGFIVLRTQSYKDILINMLLIHKAHCKLHCTMIVSKT